MTNDSLSWRMEYSATIQQKDMKTLIYTFTWEDPEVDIQHLDITSSDLPLLGIMSSTMQLLPRLCELELLL
ncbi:MAG: hypothetical protein NXY57DRAFT_968821 [Lentinula lateritia]|nr:MAG: hypothetical protein NXY57DRAFT_968821 [Lentinula lateritia]